MTQKQHGNGQTPCWRKQLLGGTGYFNGHSTLNKVITSVPPSNYKCKRNTIHQCIIKKKNISDLNAYVCSSVNTACNLWCFFFTCSGHKSDGKPVLWWNGMSSPWISLVLCGSSGLHKWFIMCTTDLASAWAKLLLGTNILWSGWWITPFWCRLSTKIYEPGD